MNGTLGSISSSARPAEQDGTVWIGRREVRAIVGGNLAHRGEDFAAIADAGQLKNLEPLVWSKAVQKSLGRHHHAVSAVDHEERGTPGDGWLGCTVLE